MPLANIFAAIPELSRGEQFDQLLHHKNVLVERIVSSGQVEPKTYLQEQDEWVILLQGQALLEVDGRELTLNAGDYRFIPAGTPHRVLHTSREPLCIWLAVHIFPHDIKP